jgi:hypothetical protein
LVRTFREFNRGATSALWGLISRRFNLTASIAILFLHEMLNSTYGRDVEREPPWLG